MIGTLDQFFSGKRSLHRFLDQTKLGRANDVCNDLSKLSTHRDLQLAWNKNCFAETMS